MPTRTCSAEIDPSSGLPTPDFLGRWSAPGGSTELPVGLALLDIAGLGAELEDPRAEYHASRKVAAALCQPLGPVDAAVRLSRREFLVVVPGASARHLAGLGDEVAEQLELASDGYPHVPLPPPSPRSSPTPGPCPSRTCASRWTACRRRRGRGRRGADPGR